jgi:hypothetical protein
MINADCSLASVKEVLAAVGLKCEPAPKLSVPLKLHDRIF